MPSKVLRSLRLAVSRRWVEKACLLTVTFGLGAAGPLAGQTVSAAATAARAVPDRLTQPIVESSRVVLAGTVHRLANQANDLGAVSDGMKLDRVQVVLKRSDAQEAALKELIRQMHAPGSANYHKWLTPEEFGKQFGPSDGDVAKLESWLGAHGFSVTKVNAGRQTLELSGTAGQFRDTFHAQIHSYKVKGAAGAEIHFANSSAPDIPAALAPVFGGFVSLNNFRFKSNARVLGKAQFNAATHESKPEWTTSNSDGSLNLVLAPGDFAVQYDLNPLYNASTPIKGTNQSIAIVNESNINIAQVNNYRTLFGLPANPPQVIIDGNDPGIDGINSPYGPNGASGEAYLDVETAGAVAPNAQINLVIADDTALEAGLILAAERAVYSNISPILSLSFSGCELGEGATNAMISNLWEQAAAQGITVVVSTGDSGSAACDDPDTQEYAVNGQAVNGLASTPYNVAVGGTDFYYSGGSSTLGTYWSLTPSNGTPTVSLKSKVPEQPWNDSQFGLDLYSVYAKSGDTETTIAAGSGGASTCGLATVNASGTVTACAPYPKPSWQTGAGVPNDQARDLPDVSLFAADGANDTFYPICATDGDCEGGSSVQITGVGGTSASAPAFAGIMALVNQKYGRQGQANYILYPLAAQFPSAFNDVAAGTNSVPCATTTVSDGTYDYPPLDCQTVTSGGYTITDQTYGTTVEGEIGLAAGVPAYSAAAGYDLASGLGTIDASNLVTNWGSVTFAPTTTTLTPSAMSFAHGTAVTISGTVTGASPTGDVALIATSVNANKQGEDFFPLINGAYSANVNTLPGGTYNISGYYSGDGANGPSSSVPVQITVTPEASTTALTIYTTALAKTPVTLASGGTVAYGALTALSAKETGVNSGTVSTVPTGTVTFLDGSTTLNTAAVNAEGDAELNSIFAIGSHSITAKYSGDGSYGTSATAAATTFTVAANTPNMNASFPNQDNYGDAVSGQTTYVAVQVENSSGYSNGQALAPTGTVKVTGAPSGVTATETLVPSVDPYSNSPEGTAYFAFPANTSGTYNLTFTFTPADSNYTTASITGQISFVGSAGSIATTTTATASMANTSPTSAVEATVVVAAPSGDAAPTGAVALYASDQQVGVASLPASNGSSATVTIPLVSGSLPPGTNQITAQYYPADGSRYIASAAVFTVNNPLDDFSLVPAATILSVPNGGTTPGVQTDTINLTSYSGFAGAVAMSCTGSGGVTCALGSSSATLAANGTASTTLTVNTSGVTAAGTYSVVVTGTDPTGHLVHTIGLQVVTPVITVPSFTLSGTGVTIGAAGGTETSTITATPSTGFAGAIALTCAISGGPAGAISPPTCATPASVTISGGSAATASLTFTTTTTTTPGTYTVTVTGTAGSVAPTTTVLVTVTNPAGPGTFSVSSSAAITIASQGGTGTSTISLTPSTTSPYAGSVTLSCAVTASPAGASEIPTCSLAPATVTLAGAAVSSTLTVATTAQTGRLDLPLKGIFTAGGGVALAALLFFGLPGGRRGKRAVRLLAVAAFALIAGAGMGCGGGSSSGGGGTGPTGGTTTGTYTVTVTGTPSSGTAQTVTVSVTVN